MARTICADETLQLETTISSFFDSYARANGAFLALGQISKVSERALPPETWRQVRTITQT
jgi:hypothetical protein